MLVTNVCGKEAPELEQTRTYTYCCQVTRGLVRAPRVVDVEGRIHTREFIGT